MTFSVYRDSSLFEWGGKFLATLLCQPSRLLDPDTWRLIYDVLRFDACARCLVTNEAASDDSDLSIGDCIDREGYSFRDNYLIGSCISLMRTELLLIMFVACDSCDTEQCLMNISARTFVQFMSNRRLLQITSKLSWLTIKVATTLM
ncbi:hypothetical protein F4604DRAFT_355453 [Suillus subluteus]|nr:hypothetical protein F4604DRAFT_355453 [Suillus subluteus]